MNLNAILASAVIGAIAGCVLGVANQFLKVEDDPRVEAVSGMLPNANCGGCGYPGCAGFADALVSGEVTSVKKCVASNPQIRGDIQKYLSETPGPDGETIKVTV